MHLSYRHVEDLIAELHGIPPSRRTALLGRFKHFKRLGFPAGVNTGRGKPADYDVSAVLRLLIAFELLQLGQTPEKAIALMKLIGFLVLDAAGYAGLRLTTGPDPDLVGSESKGGEDYYIVFDPVGLSSLANPYDEGEMAMSTIFGTRQVDLDDWQVNGGRRFAIISTTSLLSKVSIHLRDVEGIPCAEFGNELLKWAYTLEWQPRDD
ncbi:hypothetical protein [Sphingobium phenoxybenzoativorans]|uniref:hypothetical protein n=1 Tax=Sphingobium phenoxybenzoativorans TaxID=1592790 RepID=UPI00087327A7|nr:hypothetical protein [Sphingobium phenoxybenzoativorans]